MHIYGRRIPLLFQERLYSDGNPYFSDYRHTHQLMRGKKGYQSDLAEICDRHAVIFYTVFAMSPKDEQLHI